jgi:hypothetical protein
MDCNIYIYIYIYIGILLGAHPILHISRIRVNFNRYKKSGKLSEHLNYYLFVEEDFLSRILSVDSGWRGKELRCRGRPRLTLEQYDCQYDKRQAFV